MVKKIVIGNQKGGVGKTTNSVLFAYTLAAKGHKVLLCDMDPQANSTDLMTKTYARQNNKTIEFKETMMVAISNGDLRSCMLQIKENLFMLPSAEDFVYYSKFLFAMFPATEPNYEKQHMAYFGSLLKEIEDEFDYIIFDVPPTASIYMDSALFTANNILIILQTHAHSLKGAKLFFDYLQQMYNENPEVDYDILGVLPVMMTAKSPVDLQILENAVEAFGAGSLFKKYANVRERIKRYDLMGIADIEDKKNSDHHDVVLQEFYGELTDELIERAESIEREGE